MIQKIPTFFTALYMLLVGFFAFPSQYYFSDWVAYQHLDKGSVASEYITKLDLTDRSKLIIAGADPVIEPKSNFNADCQPVGQMIELGCYMAGFPDRIYIMQVQDPTISRVMDVTAAHEFLHAAYTRLTPNKRAEINALLEQQLTKIEDPNLSKRLEGYAKSEPGQRDNELHSIFGTEYRGLIPELGAHYEEFFKDRQKIVSWSETNNAYIMGREQDLKAKRARIESDDADLKALEARMSSYLATGQIAIYNSLVPTQNYKVRVLNEEIKVYNEDILAYNDLIASISNRSYSSFDAVK